MDIVSSEQNQERLPEQVKSPSDNAGKPPPSDEAKAKAREMARAYEERPTAVLPGSDRTVTGTAVNDWLDDEGNPIYGRDNTAEGRGDS